MPEGLDTAYSTNVEYWLPAPPVVGWVTKRTETRDVGPAFGVI